MHVTCINNTDGRYNKSNPKFGAELWPYPNTITNPKILEAFREKTKEFPKLILRQDDISYSNKDYFRLFHSDNDSSVLAHGWYKYTGDVPKTFDKIVERLVFIFDELRKNPLNESYSELLKGI